VHEDVLLPLTETELIEIEKQLQVTLPLSYKIFLMYFGMEAVGFMRILLTPLEIGFRCLISQMN
jgi:hypothetical protein